MRLAVIQHRIRETAEEDAQAFGQMARRAVDEGAEVLIYPEVFSLHDEPARSMMKAAVEGVIDGHGFLVPHVGPDQLGAAFQTQAIEGLSERIGTVALLNGDAAIHPEQLYQTATEQPSVVIMAPRSESDLQAEGCLELAIGLSDSIAGLIIVVEPSGAEPGQPGHGGSAIVLLGEVLAEAVEDDDLLIADVPEPVPVPSPRDPIPPIPPILMQRLAFHEGRKPEVDYPADLS